MFSESVYSVAQKRVVKAMRVSPREGGTATTGNSSNVSVQQALQAAEPYSRLILGSGQYFETLSIMKPVEIVAEEGSVPEVVNRGTCVIVSQDVECFFQNIRFVSKNAGAAPSSAALMQGVGASIRVLAGTAMFMQCECTSVFVGGSAQPTFVECKINGSLAAPGVIIAGQAGGTFQRNVISNHVPYCVCVISQGAPEFIEGLIG